VKDTGIGIPKEMLSTIFEPFEQAGGTDAKKSGTGLGLAIVKYIVDKHNGTVRVESEVGAGSTFIVALPEYEDRFTDVNHGVIPNSEIRIPNSVHHIHIL
jgi:signal transduction histidine kinase